MYNQHFGLQRAPFKITPDTSQFFAGADRGSVLEAITYAITSGEGIVKVIGEVGTGKTMLCRMLQLRLPDDIELVYISNPNVSAENILNVMAIELKIIDQPVNKISAQNHLHEYLLNAYRNNKRVVAFVEEAQAMPLETLEEIRMLSNLETDTDKLLQIVLFGQPELDKNLMHPSIRQLKERIAHNFYLQPLKIHDIKEYLNFRTRNTGYHGPDLFSEVVAKVIGRHSKGLIRRINIIADKAMLAAYADGTNTILPHHVKTAIKDSDFDANLYWQSASKNLLTGLFVVLLVIAAILIGRDLLQTQIDDPLTTNIPSQYRVPNAAIQNNLAARSDSAPPSATASPSAQASNAASEQASAPNQVATLTVEPVTPAVLDTLIAPAEADTSSNIDNTGDRTENSLPENSDAGTETLLNENIRKEYGLLNELGFSRLSERLLQTFDWLQTADEDHFTIQIMLLRNRSTRSLERYLRQIENQIAIDDVYIYETNINNTLMYGVLYKHYTDRPTAEQGVEALPGVFESSRPVMLRTIKGIREEMATSKI